MTPSVNVVPLRFASELRKRVRCCRAGKVGCLSSVDRRTGKRIRNPNPYGMMSEEQVQHPTSRVDIARCEWRRGVGRRPRLPQTHYLYNPSRLNQFDAFTTKPRRALRVSFVWVRAFTNSRSGVQNGQFRSRWTSRQGRSRVNTTAPQPLIGGRFGNGRNLVFMAKERLFDCLQRENRERVGRTTWVPVSMPAITYQVNGEQYVAVCRRRHFQLTYPYGDTVAIFKLPPPRHLGGRVPQPADGASAHHPVSYCCSCRNGCGLRRPSTLQRGQSSRFR